MPLTRRDLTRFILAAPAILAGTIGPAAAGNSELATVNQDYAQARTTFRTRLLRKGPAPQHGVLLETPPGGSLIEFGSDGKTLRAYLSQVNAERRPAVLFLHGGFALGPGDWEWALAYVMGGYVAMMPALRGENGQSGAYSYLYDEVDDVLAAVDYLAALPGVDPQRIFLVGHSIGGSLTLLTALTSRRIRAAVSFSGSPNQFSFLRAKPRLAPFDLRDTQELRMRSASVFAASLKCPIRLCHGTSENYFAAESRIFVQRARASGRDAEERAFPGDHLSEVPLAIAYSQDFFAKI